MGVNSKGFIDLHVHTNNSDGDFNPKEIIDIARENDVKTLAISDHDTIKELPDFRSYLFEDMIGINSVEFSSYIFLNGKKIRLHILGYGFSIDDSHLNNLLEELRQKRIEAHINLLNFLKKSLTTIPEKSISNLDMDRYCWFDRDLIKCMELEGYDSELINHFKKYFKSNRFSYGEDYDLDVKRVVEAIKNSNGYVVFAHPMAYKLDKNMIAEIIKSLTNIGIDGIEIYQSDCKLEDSMFLKQLTLDYKLLYSVGSDFHRIINSDGRMIGKGINDNLCIEETSLTNKILEKKLYFKGSRGCNKGG